MQTSNQNTIIYATIRILIVYPMWFYILFQVLESIQASNLTWILFWTYVPLNLLLGCLQYKMSTND